MLSDPSLLRNARRLRSYQIGALACAVIVLIGVIDLPKPFSPDQAFFTIGAWKIDHGAVLYRDYWDIKQPGIFFFYLAAGKLFGFDEIGIHAFELLYMAAFALILVITLWEYFESPWSNGLVALLTVGFYYCVSRIPHAGQDTLTQVEGLVGFPMFLCLWFASRAAGKKGYSGNLFMSGLMGGLALGLKLMFLPILLLFWVATVWYPGLRGQKDIWGPAVRSGASLLLGLLAPLLLVSEYFARHGALGALYFTSLVWPVLAIGHLPLAGPGRLLSGLSFFMGGFAPLLALAARV